MFHKINYTKLATGLLWIATTTGSHVMAAPVFNAVSLGSLDGAGGLTHGYGLNKLGQAVGESFTVEGNFNSHGFLYKGGVLSDLGTLGGITGLLSCGYGINDSGAIVGGAQLASYMAGTTWHPTHAYINVGGVMKDLNTLGGDYSNAYSINSKGKVVGDSITAQGADHAFYWNGTAMTDLGTLGGTVSSAYSINYYSQVVGMSQFSAKSSSHHAFFWSTSRSGGVMTDIGTLGGANSEARDINNNAYVVGSSEIAAPAGAYAATHGFLWSRRNGIKDMGTLGGTESAAFAINSVSLVVGDSMTTGNLTEHAFLWCRGLMKDLNSITASLPTGVALTYAWDINDNGQILAQGSDDHAYMLSPASSTIASSLKQGRCP